jgi:hypothetical protein
MVDLTISEGSPERPLPRESHFLAKSATNLRVPQNPNFLWGFGDPTSFMRLSLMKAAHAVLGGAAYRKFGP